MRAPTQNELIRFIDQEIDISPDSLAMAIRQSQTSLGSLPMILWQYGLVNLNQLEKIFVWLEDFDTI
ncbi:DUF2949 domain-containing protein [Gloeocapsa sp. PCC 73106]|uniref:DUF2949 domain-containing protein n=1 Tax=Gloeocapsa sp. PCC 73106 TaxID=102232 RepID=UPI0002ABCA15|nr:DUF2949 domain-containing protein [Gloeocapsa sp. PCC 73106]ELR99743.1 Protein of unknown function (DUF2949) [Gloeocapsa sp. PCC 73106]